MRILVVEDEQALADAIASGLGRQGYSADVAYDGEQALVSTEVNSYDLILLDLNLPKIDGVEVCRRVRAADSNVGIVMLTARSALDDRVAGLDIGADDYIVKPFHFPELLARIRAVLRREGNVKSTILRVDDVVLDPNTSRVLVGDNLIALTTKEFGILEYLMSHAGRTISQEELLEHVWNDEANLFTQSIKVHINNIRRKLELAGVVDFISTIKGRGYLVG
jgi:DNA-binding response OmpR family regulator